MQLPELQFEPAGHAFPQEPQLVGSVLVLAHTPFPHATVPPEQVDEQTWLLHTSPDDGQAIPQPPQLLEFSAMQPLLQLKRPGLQLQTPELQV